MSRIPREAMGNATSLFNLTRNLGGSIGIAMVTTMYARFTQKFVNRLSENITPFHSAASNALEGLRNLWLDTSGPGLADQRAIATIFGVVQRQAALLAFIELFRVLALIFLAMLPLVLLMKRPPKSARAEMGH